MVCIVKGSKYKLGTYTSEHNNMHYVVYWHKYRRGLFDTRNSLWAYKTANSHDKHEKKIFILLIINIILIYILNLQR